MITNYPALSKQFSNLHNKLPYLSLDELFGYFACFGGVEENINIDFFASLEDNIIEHFTTNYEKMYNLIEPNWLTSKPYSSIMTAVAKGDGKILNVFKRAKVSEALGGGILSEIKKSGIVWIEESREQPIKRFRNLPIKKELRGYRIQSKVRFIKPFDRFFFGFVLPFEKDLKAGKYDRFINNYLQHKDRAQSLIFEQLSNELLKLKFADIDPIISSGSLWERINEYDIYCTTQSGKKIIGECKFKNRKVCSSELNKLKEKIKNSNMSIDIYAIISKSGFSTELLETKSDKLLLYTIDDFEELLKS